MRAARARLIFQAAIDTFAERGFDKATMDEIAAKAQVAKGTIYYHFRSKEELFVFLVQQGTELLRERVLSKLDPDASAEERLRTVIRAQLTFFKEYKDFCIIILREAWGEESRQREFRRMLVHYVQGIRDVVRDGIEEGAWAADDPEAAAWSVFGAASITAIHHLFKDPAFDLDSLAPGLETLLLHGLARLTPGGED